MMFEEQQKKFLEYKQNEEQTIANKVEKEQKSFVGLTSEKALLLEQQKENLEQRLVERTYRLGEQDGLVIGQHKALCDTEKKEKIQDSIIDNLKSQIKQLETKIGLQEGEIKEKDSRVKDLEVDNEKITGAILKLGDVRSVINRVWEPHNDSRKVIDKLKNDEFQINRNGSQNVNNSIPVRQSAGQLKPMPNNVLNRSYGQSNQNLRNDNQEGDDFWYSDAKQGEKQSKLDPVPNQYSQALRDPTAQSQIYSNNQNGGYYQNPNQSQKTQNRMNSENTNQGYDNVNSSQNKRGREMNYNYYD